ncbi:MAG: GTP cyclohydrolase I [Sulfolobales archaeon]|jgi:GTP cyclohydrolase I|nr:GTP cyclohydrolase I [Sulfolobales archaeon]MCQ4336885.1 GTP cyclohydrolase I [Sulfolobales archaeon]MCQ4384580.1 GTP cyclohydrolase I [Sulfolobales archaeon]MCQ4447897.1 GTP cyclohydrolase I [Sulfolobales archaeon]MDT7899085.1 GTP cyclohydrolase I [Sulfolobales archaeon]
MTYETETSETLEERIAYHVKEILKLLGEDVEREGLRETPKRVARALLEMTSALRTKMPYVKVFKISEDGVVRDPNQIVLVRNVSFTTLCEHHFLPVIGKMHVAYVVGDEGKVAGFSKIIRLVNYFASKPQLQERLVSEVADALMNSDVKPKGVLVVSNAIHMCTYVRGVKDKEATLMSIATRGVFVKDNRLKSYVLRMLTMESKKELI